MSERRVVRNVGRPVYGRPQPVRSRRPSRRRINLGPTGRRVVGLIVAAMALVGILQLVFGIRHITVQAPSAVDQITKEATAAIHDNWHQGNLLTFSDDTLAASLIAADPLIKDVTAKRRWPSSLALTVTLKQPSLGWSSGNQAYLLDADGTVISALPAGQGVAVVVDDSNLPVTIGYKVTTTRFVSFTTAVASGVGSMGLSPTKLEIKESTLDLYMTTNKGYQLVFDTSRAPADELADLKTILAALASQHKLPTQYIDLRIVGKAYYK